MQLHRNDLQSKCAQSCSNARTSHYWLIKARLRMISIRVTIKQRNARDPLRKRMYPRTCEHGEWYLVCHVTQHFNFRIHFLLAPKWNASGLRRRFPTTSPPTSSPTTIVLVKICHYIQGSFYVTLLLFSQFDSKRQTYRAERVRLVKVNISIRNIGL